MKSNSTQSKIHLQGYGGNKLQSLKGTTRVNTLKHQKFQLSVKTIAMMLVFLFSVSIVQAQITSTATGGTWATGSTWVGGVVPTTGQNVVIATTGANSVSIAANLTQTGSVTVNNGATLNMTTTGVTISLGALTINSGGTATVYRDFTVTGATSISGTINFGSTSTSNRTMTFTGDVTLNSGAVWNETTTGAVADFSFAGNLTNNATTFTAQNNAAAVHTFTGSAKTLSGTTITAIPYLTINGTTTNNGTLTVAAILAGSSTLTNGATGTLNIGGTSPITGLTATAVGNTVNYSGAAQTVKGTAYNNLTLSGSGTKTVAASTVVSGNLTISGTAVASLTGTANTANALFFGATQQVSGTWGSTSSTAAHTNNTTFSGTGLVTVASSTGPVLGITGTTAHGSSCVGIAATPITYTITNTGTTATGVTVTSNNPQFVVSAAPTTVAGGGTATYVVTFTPSGSGAQNATITVASTTPGSNSPTSSLTGSGNALPTITGTLGVCVGLTTQLTGSASPAASTPWVSANPSVATISSLGLVTAVSAGTCVITYTNNNGCSINATVTVNALPTITGNLGACVGSTTQLTGSGTPAGSTPWVSASTGVATISNTGLVTGVSVGSSVITYTNNNGCSITATVTVQNVIAAPVITTSPICAGTTTVSGTSVIGASIIVYKAGSVVVGTATANGSGVWIATVSALATADVVTATASVGGGCLSVPSASVTVQSVTNAPVISSPICAGTTTVSGTSENNAVINVFKAGSTFVGTTTANGAGAWTATVSVMTAADVITATASVGGKCLSAASTPVTVLSVTNTPVITSTSLCPGATTVSGTSENGASITVYTAGTNVVGTAVANGSGVWTATVSALASANVVTATATVGGKCVSVASSSVIVNAAPTPSFTSQPGVSSCIGVNVTYTTQPGMSNYVWGFPGVLNTDYSITSGGTSNDNTVTLRFLTTGSKTVTVYYTNGNGCTAASATSSTPTNINTLPVITYTAQAAPNVCLGVDVTYTTQSGMTGYTWVIPGQVLNTDYSITSGGTTADNSITLKYLTPGIKYVTVNYINLNGCMAASPAPSLSTTANSLPTVTFTSTPTGSCVGVDVTYTTQAGMSTYLWTVPGTLGVDYTISSGSIGTTSNTVTLNYMTTGIKTVTVNYTNGSGCTAATATSSTITVSTLPAISLTVRGSASICSGTGTNITVDGSVIGTNYQLRNNNGNAPVGSGIPGNGGTIYLPTGPLTTGTTFNVLATLGSCSAQLSDISEIIISPLPALNLAVGGTGSICSGSGSFITIGASVIGTSYQLRNNNANEPVGSALAGTGSTISLPTGNLVATTTFNVLATLGSCSAQLTNTAVVTISPLPAINLIVGGAGSINTGQETNITVAGSVIGTNYQLRNSSNSNELIGSAVGGTGGTINLPTGALTQTTTYNILATLGSCAAQLTNTVVVTVGPTGIDDIKDNSGLRLKNHPNPFGGNTTISYTLPADGRVKLVIRSLTGQIVKTVVNEIETQGDYTLNIDLSNLQSGIYMATISLQKDGKEVLKTIRLVKGNN